MASRIAAPVVTNNNRVTSDALSEQRNVKHHGERLDVGTYIGRNEHFSTVFVQHSISINHIRSREN